MNRDPHILLNNAMQVCPIIDIISDDTLAYQKSRWLKHLFIEIIILFLSIANSNYKPLFISITNTYQGNLSNPLHFSYLAVGGFDWNLVFNWHGVCTLKILFLYLKISFSQVPDHEKKRREHQAMPAYRWHICYSLFIQLQLISIFKTLPRNHVLWTFICSIFGRLRNIAVQLYFISLVSFPITSLI